MTTHYGTTIHGQEYELEVSHGQVFRCHGTPGFERVEVCVEDGVITHSQFLPDEMDQWQARAFAAMLKEAADVKEKADAQAIRDVMGGMKPTTDFRWMRYPLCDIGWRHPSALIQCGHLALVMQQRWSSGRADEWRDIPMVEANPAHMEGE